MPPGPPTEIKSASTLQDIFEALMSVSVNVCAIIHIDIHTRDARTTEQVISKLRISILPTCSLQTLGSIIRF